MNSPPPPHSTIYPLNFHESPDLPSLFVSFFKVLPGMIFSVEEFSRELLGTLPSWGEWNLHAGDISASI